MRRRDLLIAATVLPQISAGLHAQSATKRPVIGILSLNGSANDPELVAAFIDGLASLGYADGKTATLITRSAGGDPALLPGFAQEIARARPDLVMADVGGAITAMKKAAPSVPLVGSQMNDPVALGLVSSFAHPGGEVTGIASVVDDILAKLLDLALQAVGGVKRIGVLLNPVGFAYARERDSFVRAAQKRGVDIVTADARSPADLSGAIRSLADAKPGFILLQPNGMLRAERRQIARSALEHGLPVIASMAQAADSGFLLVYGIDDAASYRRAATFADRILKGANPADLPVEVPTKFILIINLKIARKLDIDISQSLLVQADRVIE
jgi:putative ABC transport system substrate-binding protein